ncbi:MAG: Fur family transcriptional regulator [Actinomycetota bacterium]|nr:Fur family transcriptional regulator [Actinomycetota bacterium]
MRTADAAETIRDAGLRATRPRVLIYNLLQAAGGHLTADEVAGLVSESGQELARASIYNVLDDLARVDLVMRADRGPGTAIYEVADTWHHHFVCRECGGVTDVPCAIGSKPCLDADLPGAVIDEAQIIFRGICASCADST